MVICSVLGQVYLFSICRTLLPPHDVLLSEALDDNALAALYPKCLARESG